MPRKDLKARAEYGRQYRQDPAKRARIKAGQDAYWAKPGNKQRSKAIKRRSLGLPEPTRPEPPLCECCNQPSEAKRGLHLDHDHVTGAFRGWLCHHCNTGIGLLGDNRLGVSFALAYLSLHG